MSTCTDCIKIDVFERERDAAIANLAKAEARITEAHAALEEAGAPACDGVLSGRVTALADKLSTAQADLAYPNP